LDLINQLREGGESTLREEIVSELREGGGYKLREGGRFELVNVTFSMGTKGTLYQPKLAGSELSYRGNPYYNDVDR